MPVLASYLLEEHLSPLAILLAITGSMATTECMAGVPWIAILPEFLFTAVLQQL